MRLLSKTSLLIITVSIFIFMIGNIIFFNVLKSMINKHVKAELTSRMYELINGLNQYGINPEKIHFKEDLAIQKFKDDKIIRPVICDTVLYDKIQRKYIPHKSLRFTYIYKDETYLISVYKSMLSSNKLIERITIASIFLVLSFLLAIYILNRFIFVNVWSNFIGNLRKINNYNINSHKELELELTEIDEFRMLNSVLQQMVEKIRKDFTNLKELTENTSHEIQTPLAIIRSKAENLLQSDQLSEKDLQLVYSILNTSDRLSKLNQSLLMISKIGNDQFEDTALINLKDTLEKYIENFEMLLKAGNFKLTVNISDLHIKINSVLLDVLISNVLKNALVHNFSEGEIKIRLDGNVLKISNTGVSPGLNPDYLFKRFIKGSEDIKRSGLGLEIVKKVCDYYGMSVQYNHSNDLHHFSVDFSSVSL